MNNIQLSIIIPSHNEIYLQKTIDSLLDNSEIGDQLEIIPVLDGYWPTVPLKNDPRVKVLHLGKNGGMKNAINKGMSVATGKYVGRLDEHCMFSKGWDRILLADITDTDLWTLRRKKLDPEKWEVMTELREIDYERLIIRSDPTKFAGVEWLSRKKEREDIMIDETGFLQGSFWVMSKKLWDDVIGGEIPEGEFGPLYSDQLWCAMKIWQSGGRIMVTKKCWFAHKSREFKRTHSYGGEEARIAWQYAVDYFKDYYYAEIFKKWG
jgi:glycosyltransferase involved in cell wall biosynthesis